MWHTPNQRLRAIANARKRERDRLKRPFHIKRVLADVILRSGDQILEEVAPLPVRVILNDFTVRGVGLFSQTPLSPGQEIILGITAPMKLDIRARVIWCQQHDANTHVLSEQPFSYRMSIEFMVPPDDQPTIKAFWEESCRSYLYASRV